ncbi:hypothetical protein [Roseisolibacter sp. H3M3-2]|uniref:hypothetical protein n=1 Tax=Roseisolibacter sp. H3M3-2 TaxID=3031323 RepID=UPI0023DBA4C3|nr:hypothetical protein [Roseisolibacter sp. H3M3-2]MDF1502801.1 hypothetical protein [Roseisolibacter sp. H3M3-2]
MSRRFLPALLALALAAGAAPTGAPAQPRRARPDSLNAPTLPRDVARDVAARFNAPGTTRAFGRFEVPAGTTVAGDVAVLDGPVVVAGTITGRLTAVNADVTFRTGARVDGDVLVVGGVVEGRLDAELRGDYVRFRQPLQYTRDGERVVADLDDEGVGTWFRWRRTDAATGRRTTTGLTLTTGRTYNRVEGLPIQVGPSVEHAFSGGRARVDLLGIFRTAEQFAWDSGNVGHLARAELRLGRRLEARVGGRLYDQVTPVESWQLDGTESGLAAFLARRDFRDWFGRHGAAAYASLFAGPDASVTLSLADERWAARGARDVFTLFRPSATWRPNPAADEGRVHVLNATVRVDTRNDVDRPWAGWYVEADYERGTGAFTAIAPTSVSLPSPGYVPPPPGVFGARDLTPGRRTYGRGFLDVRRYNRLSPDRQLNFRVVLGGWLHGDELPLQRRFSVTGPGALPGFDFRQPAPVGRERSEVGLCRVGGTEPAGSPAQCERMAMAQVEYRGDIRVRLFGDDDGGRVRRRAWRTDFSWVVFADAGRGWLVGPRDAQRQVYPRGSVPPLGSFLADVGAGLDFGNHRANDVGSVGIYVAKAVTRPSPGTNLIVRVGQRF